MTEPDVERVLHVMLDEARDDLAKADHKAALVLASLGVGFAAIFGGILAGDWKPADLTGVGQVIWWAGVVGVASAVVCSGAAVWPRYKGSDGSSGIYYWAHVATFESLAAFNGAIDANLLRIDGRTRHQLWSISRILKRKYSLIRWALGLSLVGVLTLIIGLAVDSTNA